MFFRNREFTIFGNLESAKLRIRERANFRDLDSVKTRSHEHAEAWNLELAKARTSEDSWFGNLSGIQFGSHVWRNSRIRKEAKSKLSSKKSGFWVWTGGRLVNMLDEKDILVCIHIRNILWARGRFRNVKVPSSPYKRGCEGTCKRIQIFWNLCNRPGEPLSLSALTLCLSVLRTPSLVLGESSEFFG
jgi:hypothetical protein